MILININESDRQRLQDFHDRKEHIYLNQSSSLNAIITEHIHLQNVINNQYLSLASEIKDITNRDVNMIMDINRKNIKELHYDFICFMGFLIAKNSIDFTERTA